MTNIIMVITTALISGLFATLITIFWQNRTREYTRKLRVFETLMSTRYLISSEESVKALNSIDIVFYKNKHVREAYKEFLNETDKKPEFDANIGDKYLRVLEEISKSLKLGDIHWDEIKHTYYPSGLSEKLQEENILRKMQIQNTAVLLQSKATQQNTPMNEQFQQQIVAQILSDLIKNPESIKNFIDLADKFGVKSK